MMRTALWATLVGGLSAVGAAADEFGIVNKVYDGRELVSTSTTLFTDAAVYDFLDGPDETVILSTDTGTFELLDNKRRLRTLVTAEAVTSFYDALQAKAMQSDSEIIRFHAAPQFREALDPETRELVLSSPLLEYRSKTVVPPSAEALRRYQGYLTWQARLNTLLVPGSPPAGPREAFNAALAKRQVLAQEVTLKRSGSLPGFNKTLRAEHLYTWRLDEPDRKRVAEANHHRATFQFVAPVEYLRRPAATARR